MNMLLRLSPLLLCACASTARQGQNSLRIGSWNLEHFGSSPALRAVTDPGQPRRELPGRDDGDLKKIGAFITELGVSVLAVQEINGEAPLRQLCPHIGPSWDCFLGTSGGWTDGKSSQAIGFLYDTARVRLLWAEELNDFPREQDGLPIYHRVPVTACFQDTRTGIDFRAVCVHLKAGRDKSDVQKRKLEATGLRDWLVLLQSNKGEDQDIVVMGDFNSTYGDDPQTVFEEAGVARYLPQPKPEPTILHFPEPIDQIAASPRFLEIVPHTFDAHGEASTKDRDAWRKTYSDHFPVTVDLVAAGDDDPQATFSHGKNLHVLPVSLRPQPDPATKSDAAAEPSAARPQRADPFPIGTAVYVFTTNGDKIGGTLLAPLGEWVVLRDVPNYVIRAFPAAQVREVQKQKQ